MTRNLNFQEDYILEDERVLLRPLKKEDWTNLLSIALNEPDTWKYSLLSAAGEDGLKNYIKIAMQAKESGKEYPFIVFDKKLQRYAGSTRFYDINLPFKTLLLGYTWYGKDFRGTGLNKHCKFLLLSFAFEKLGIERVEFRADNNNEKSIAAMKSIGCKVEGVLRNNQPTRDEEIRRDSIILSIIKEEWFGGTKESLAKKLA
ncbi:MAG: GNAT family protein [Ginsengibacter sp.]